MSPIVQDLTARRRASTAIAFVSVLATSVAAIAQDDADTFESTVTPIRDSVQRELTDAYLASEQGITTSPVEAWLMGPVTAQLPRLAELLGTYADDLDTLEPPSDLTDDVDRHVGTLREVAQELSDAAEAAATGSDVDTFAHYDSAAEGLARLAAELDPRYFDYAFVTPFREDFRSFQGLTPEEVEYLDGVRDAAQQFELRNRDAFGAIRGTYPSSEAMMLALHEAGAGEAMAAVQEAAVLLVAPDRFADEHAWWLANLAEQVRLDRLIGQAAEDGDAAAFMANNIRLGMASRSAGPDAAVYPALDPAFGAAIAPGSPLSGQIDPASPAARDRYAAALLHALRIYAWSDPVANATASFDFPGVSMEMQMQAVAETADELAAAWATFEVSLQGLEPSTAYSADHALLLKFASDHGRIFDALLAASRSGDGAGVRASMDDLRTSFCAASGSFSDALAPVTEVLLDPSLDLCRG